MTDTWGREADLPAPVRARCQTPDVVTTRPARPEDATAIVDVNVRAWQVGYRGLLPDAELDGIDADERLAGWRRFLADPGASEVIVAEVAGVGIAGFASCGPSRRTTGVGEVYTCYVDPQRWGGGIGRALLAAVERALIGQGFADAELWTLDGNERALRFYRAAGWEPDGTVEHREVWGTDTTDVRLRRSLVATFSGRQPA